MDRLLANNNVVKIIALLLALALWFVVNGESKTTPEYNRDSETYRISQVSLEAKIDTDEFTIMEIPKTVSLELKGTPLSLSRNISPSEYEVYVDLTQLGKGKHQVPVQVTGFPSDISVRVIPEKITVTMEEKQRVEKEVTPQYVGNPQDGYTRGEAIVKPKKVHITLPESKIKDVSEVVAVIDIEGANDVIEQTVPLRVIDRSGNSIPAEINPTLVEISVPVTSPFKQIPIKINYTNEPPAGFSVESVELKTDNITVYGPLEVVNKLNFYPGPQIDLSTFREKRLLQLRVPLLPNVVKTEPDFVELEVNVSPSVQKTIESNPIKVNGLSEGFNITFINPEDGLRTITVEGTQAKVDSLNTEDIELYVDLSNLPPGEHEVPIHMNLPTFITSKEDPGLMRALVRIEKVE